MGGTGKGQGVSTDGDHNAPLPLEGEGVGGWGGRTDRADQAPETPLDAFDRFARVRKIAPNGVARARRLRQSPTRTEAKLWDRLHEFEPRFRRQAPIGPYVVDFACLRKRLVIEVDGGVHDVTEVALRDLKRDEWLASEGYRVLRIPAKRVETDIDGVVADIAKSIGVYVPPGAAPASTPSQPFPLEGKGSSDVR